MTGDLDRRQEGHQRRAHASPIRLSRLPPRQTTLQGPAIGGRR
jgi:hypothetical protein